MTADRTEKEKMAALGTDGSPLLDSNLRNQKPQLTLPVAAKTPMVGTVGAG